MLLNELTHLSYENAYCNNPLSNTKGSSINYYFCTIINFLFKLFRKFNDRLKILCIQSLILYNWRGALVALIIWYKISCLICFSEFVASGLMLFVYENLFSHNLYEQDEILIYWNFLLLGMNKLFSIWLNINTKFYWVFRKLIKFKRLEGFNLLLMH